MNRVNAMMFVWLLLFISPLMGKEWIAPGQNGGEPVYSPGMVREGPDGRVYILDVKAERLKVYTADGAWAATLLRNGEGPGDVKRFEGLRFDFTPDGRLFFTEIIAGHRWITVLDPSGRFLQTITPKRKEPFYGFAGAAFLPNGDILAAFIFPGTAQKKPKYYLNNSPIVLSLMKKDGVIIRDIWSASPVTRISFLPMGGDIQIPFAPDSLWTLHAAAGLILAESNSPEFTLIALPDGRRQTATLSLPPAQPVSAEDLTAWRNRVKENFMQRDRNFYMKFGRVVEELQSPVHKTKPFIGSISATPEGNLLVSVYRDIPWREMEFYLFDPRLKLLVKWVSKVHITGVYFSRNLVFIYKTDEDDAYRVYWRKRDGKEAEILTSLAPPLT